ncbi:hypothetical protein [Shewanella morhuae]|uniref:Uncharacterized protein n=1 Tax=Shewanella morhuae TaxID=365591 RepID=A0A380AZX0_9GAMM|nr:hypothetical protein [Shewanella morhuae]GIU01861.1 hypothetical protein TUM4641_00980 [Shewanella morhuae]SUI90755.1 Uncharacterised protein [Shewanella morhuae]
MLAHQLYFIRIVLMALMMLFMQAIIPVSAQLISEPEPESEPSVTSLSKPKKTEPLPLGTLLDSHGQPINIPHQTQSALEYSTPVTVPINPSKTKSTQSVKTSKAKKLNRKQQLASRNHVANDPNCRWLDQRIGQLEAQLNGKQSNNLQHVSDEASIRNKEWQCLKCGAEGPDQNDHSNCQYRRETNTK